MTDSFRVPRDGGVFSERIFRRCRDLIEFDAWSGIPMARFNSWLGNFATEEESYFAACILDALIYHSTPQTVALLQQLFQRVLPDFARHTNLHYDVLADCFDNLHRSGSDTDPKIRIVPVVTKDDPPTKSGQIIARTLKRHLRFCEDWIIWPRQIPDAVADGVDVFIFVDDFLGTGNQFHDFIASEALGNILGGHCCIYGPLSAHERGAAFLSQELRELYVTPVELLIEDRGLFSNNAPWFKDGVNCPAVARSFYYELLRDRNIDIKGAERRGFGVLDIAIAFEHAAPDNALPILWWDEADKWAPLFDR